MQSPFHHRPEQIFYDEGYEGEDENEDWADNPSSNAMAWVSQTFMPRWCSTPYHWTSRLMDYFYTDCPCCLFLRGVTVGIIATAWAALGLCLLL